MEAVGAASAIVGLPIPVFHCVKGLAATSFVEYEKDINILESPGLQQK